MSTQEEFHDVSDRERCRELAEKAGYDSTWSAYERVFKKSWGPPMEVWKQYPIPINPIGHVPFERDRQLLTFVLPFAVVGYSWGHWGLHTLVATIPLAVFLWRLQYSLLKRAIDMKRREEWNIDLGRYHRTKAMSKALGLPLHKITPHLIECIAWGYCEVDAYMAHRKYLEDKEAVRLRYKASGSPQRFRCSGESVQAAAGTVAGVGTASAVAVDHFHDRGYDSSEYSPPLHESYAFNPANGLPMVGGGTFGVDVGGNAYGTNDF